MHSLLTPLKTPAIVTFSLLLLLAGTPINATEVTDNLSPTSTTCKMLSPPLQGTKDAYHDIFKCFRNNAEQGDIAAIVNLAHSYYFGIGIPQNFQKALRWYTEAADSNNAEAMFRIGVMYAEGHGVEKNAGKAQEWYDKAVATGDAQAEFNFGIAKIRGYYFQSGSNQTDEESDLKKRSDKGLGWLSRAAENHYLPAQVWLGYLYYFGLGDPIKPNPALAEKWLERAAQQGSWEAANLMAHIYIRGTPTTPVDMTQAYIWGRVADYTPHGNYGNLRFRNFSSFPTYWQGDQAISIDKMNQRNLVDAEKIISNIRKQIAQNQIELKDGRYANDFINIINKKDITLWGLHNTILITPANKPNEINWKKMRLEFNLSDMLPSGYIPVKAGNTMYPGYIEALQYASNNNDQQAQSNLGLLYLQGIGIPQNYEKAFELLKKAAQQGNTEATFSLGVIYESNVYKGVDRDVQMAKSMMEKAALHGHNLAAWALSTNLFRYKCNTRPTKNQLPSIEIIKEAYIWASISVAYGLPGQIRNCLLQQLPTDQIAQAQEDTAMLFIKIQENNK